MSSLRALADPLFVGAASMIFFIFAIPFVSYFREVRRKKKQADAVITRLEAEKNWRKIDAAASVLAVFVLLSISACGGNGGGSGSVTTPPSSGSVTITQQPASVSVVAPAPAQFAVGASTTSGTLHYQWSAQAPSGDSANVGGDSSTYVVEPTAMNMSGTKISVAVSADADPVTSKAATLTVTQSIGPSGNPVFVSATPFPNSGTQVAIASTSVVVPIVQSGAAYVCFDVNTTIGVAESLPTQANVVTDSLNDSFTLIGDMPEASMAAQNDGPENNPTLCFGAATAGGANVTFNVNLGFTLNSWFAAVVLNYTGSSAQLESFANSWAFANQANSGQLLEEDTPTISFDASRLLLSVGVGATEQEAAGTAWTKRYVDPTGFFLVEDQIVTSGGSAFGSFILENANDCTSQINCPGAWAGFIAAVN